MSEIDFIVRRILKEAEEWTELEYEERPDNAGTKLYYQNMYRARIQLIQHLRKSFTGKTYEEKNG